jgi:hypothetical protein
LKHNEVKNLGIILANKRIYRIVSTGSIMLNSFSDSRSYFFPSLEGSFLGKIFYGIADATPGDVWDDWKFLLINTLNDTKIKIFDLEFNRLYTEFNFPAGKNCSLKIKPTLIFIDSDNPITVMFLSYGHPFKSNYIGGGLVCLGIKAKQMIPIYIPEKSEAYLFTSEETTISLDGAGLRIGKDSFISLPPGFHSISSEMDSIFMMAHRPLLPENQGLYSFGICIPSIQSMKFEYKIKPSLNTAYEISGILILTGIFGICIAIIIALYISLFKRRRFVSK